MFVICALYFITRVFENNNYDDDIMTLNYYALYFKYFIQKRFLISFIQYFYILDAC